MVQIIYLFPKVFLPELPFSPGIFSLPPGFLSLLHQRSIHGLYRHLVPKGTNKYQHAGRSWITFPIQSLGILFVEFWRVYDFGFSSYPSSSAQIISPCENEYSVYLYNVIVFPPDTFKFCQLLHNKCRHIFSDNSLKSPLSIINLNEKMLNLRTVSDLAPYYLNNVRSFPFPVSH